MSPVSTTYICPLKCKCEINLKLVDCRGRSLRQIPNELPLWTENLNFGNNKISNSNLNITKLLDSLPNLLTLDLSFNELLTELHFSTSKNFHPLTHIKVNNCNIKSIPKNKNLRQVKRITLEANKIAKITNRIKDWELLEHLNLGWNRIRKLQERIFSSNRKLITLNLEGNRLTQVTKMHFHGLVSLSYLNLGKNSIENVKDFQNKQLGCNQIFPNLKYLDLSWNKISFISYMNFNGICELRTINLRKNYLQDMNDGAFWGVTKLNTLLLDENLLTSVRKGWQFIVTNSESSPLEYLSLANNRIKEIEFRAFSLSKSLKFLNLSGNSLSSNMFYSSERKKVFKDLHMLQQLDISSNKLAFLHQYSLHGLHSLTYLDLSRNYISFDSKQATESKTLQFENESVFVELPKLKYLNLNNNKITSLPEGLLLEQTQLEVLDLTGNELTSFGNHSLPQLTKIYNNNVRVYISTNNLLCDCKLLYFSKWSYNYLSLRNTSEDLNAVCSHPEYLKGKNLKDIEKNRLKCGNQPVPYMLVEPPSRYAVRIGENVTLECTSTVLLTSLTNRQWIWDEVAINTTWWKEGKIWMGGETLVSHDNQTHKGRHVTTSMLFIRNVGFEDQGKYRCLSKNKFGTASSTQINMLIVSEPRITRQPPTLHIVVNSNSDVDLVCEAEGEPRPVLGWNKLDGELWAVKETPSRLVNMEQLTEENIYGYSNYLSSVTMNVRILHAKPKDAGRYQCKASSEFGEDSFIVDLKVQFAPSIKLPVSNEVKQRLGNTLSLYCSASAWPSPSIKWLLGEKDVETSIRHFITNGNRQLIVYDVNYDDAGVYSCVASNKLGRSKIQFHVKVVSNWNSSLEWLGNLDDSVIKYLIGMLVVVITLLVWLCALCCYRKTKLKVENVNIDYAQGTIKMTSLLQQSSNEKLNTCSRSDEQISREISPKTNKTVVKVSIMTNSKPYLSIEENFECSNQKKNNDSVVETSDFQLTNDDCKIKHRQNCTKAIELIPSKNYKNNISNKFSNCSKSEEKLEINEKNQ